MDMSNVAVLLVEDDNNVRMTIKAMLHEMGITIIQEARDGEAALKLINDSRGAHQLVVCDWNMPNKSGIDLLRELRRNNNDIPFIMVTARADEMSIITAKETQVTAYIRKPFSFGELNTKVRAVLLAAQQRFIGR